MKRNKFSLSHRLTFSCDMGELVPIGLTEVLPGDTFQHGTSLLLRVSPLLAPVMHPVDIRVHHFFVPFRLIWEDWEDFITGGPDGMDASQFPLVNLTPAVAGVGSLADYLGVPTITANTTTNVLPFRAYALIYNECYRDQDLQNPLVVNLASTANDTTTNRTLMNINWEKDYFTSARPWTQKGPEVRIPLTGDAPISGIGLQSTSANLGVTPDIRETGATDVTTYPNSIQSTAAGLWIKATGAGPNTNPDIHAKLSGVTAATINDLRTALALQRYEENRARYGSRYTEYLRLLGVRSSDARLQRPEYLGGGKQTIQFSEVLQTGPDDPENGNVVGALKGHGIGAMRSNRYRRFFEEHGYVVSLMSVRPRTMYVQGLSRLWNRRVKEDFFQHELQHIGQQQVLNKELYVAATDPDGVFGYQDRYDEYRRQESRIAGEFRTTELDFWHMARIFSSEPVLNSTFVESVPTKRINAVQTNDVLWVMAAHSLKARRMVSSTGTSFIR